MMIGIILDHRRKNQNSFIRGRGTAENLAVQVVEIRGHRRVHSLLLMLTRFERGFYQSLQTVLAI